MSQGLTLAPDEIARVSRPLPVAVSIAVDNETLLVATVEHYGSGHGLARRHLVAFVSSAT